MIKPGKEIEVYKMQNIKKMVILEDERYSYLNFKPYTVLGQTPCNSWKFLLTAKPLNDCINYIEMYV